MCGNKDIIYILLRVLNKTTKYKTGLFCIHKDVFIFVKNIDKINK